jgi:hypothetical protein
VKKLEGEISSIDKQVKEEVGTVEQEIGSLQK